MLKSWKNKEIDLGVIKPYKKLVITFECSEVLDDVSTITSSCGCSSGHVSGNNVIVDFKPANIPTHLEKAGVKLHKIRKTIRVHYNNGQVDILQFYGTLKK